MVKLKRLNKQKCECGRTTTEGSVFCLCCRAAIKRKNVKTLSGGKRYQRGASLR